MTTEQITEGSRWRSRKDGRIARVRLVVRFGMVSYKYEVAINNTHTQTASTSIKRFLKKFVQVGPEVLPTTGDEVTAVAGEEVGKLQGQVDELFTEQAKRIRDLEAELREANEHWGLALRAITGGTLTEAEHRQLPHELHALLQRANRAEIERVDVAVVLRDMREAIEKFGRPDHEVIDSFVNTASRPELFQILEELGDVDLGEPAPELRLGWPAAVRCLAYNALYAAVTRTRTRGADAQPG